MLIYRRVFPMFKLAVLMIYPRLLSSRWALVSNFPHPSTLLVDLDIHEWQDTLTQTTSAYVSTRVLSHFINKRSSSNFLRLFVGDKYENQC